MPVSQQILPMVSGLQQQLPLEPADPEHSGQLPQLISRKAQRTCSKRKKPRQAGAFCMAYQARLINLASPSD